MKLHKLKPIQKIISYFLMICVMSASLYANIVYKGDCGSYTYDLNISSNRYYGGMCVNGVINLYDDTNRDEIKMLYVDPAVSTWVDIVDLQNFRVDRSLDSGIDAVKLIGNPSFELLSGFAGLLVGFSFFYVVMRLV